MLNHRKCDVNCHFVQEKERQRRSRLAVRSELRLKMFSHYRKGSDDDDDDDVPPGTSSSGFGSFHNGPPVIF